MEYINDAIESFDNYFSRKKNKCKLNHVKQLLGLFINAIKKQFLKLTESHFK